MIIKDPYILNIFEIIYIYIKFQHISFVFAFLNHNTEYYHSLWHIRTIIFVYSPIFSSVSSSFCLLCSFLPTVATMLPVSHVSYCPLHLFRHLFLLCLGYLSNLISSAHTYIHISTYISIET